MFKNKTANQCNYIIIIAILISTTNLQCDLLYIPQGSPDAVVDELNLPVFSPVLRDTNLKNKDESEKSVENIVTKVVSGSENDLKKIAKELASDESKLKDFVEKVPTMLTLDTTPIKQLNNTNLLKTILDKINEIYRSEELIKNKISLKVQDAKLDEIISLINKVSNLNIVVDSDINGFVRNLNVNNLPLAHVLKIILSQQNPELTIIKDLGIYRIIMLSKAYEHKIRESSSFTTNDFDSKIFILQNQKITETIKLRIEKMWQGITKSECSKPGYYLVCDDESRKIFFRGKKEYVQDFQKYLNQIDVHIPQIKIEARVVIAHKDFEESFGLQWSDVFNRRAGIKRGVSFVGSGPLVDINNEPKPQGIFSLTDWALNMFPVIGEASRTLHIPFVFGGNDLNTKRLNVVLNAAENRNELKTILKPSLVTNHGEEAEILVGEQIPLEVIVKENIEGSLRDITTVNYRDIGIKLKVRPLVSPNLDSIFLDIYVENSFRANKAKYPIIEMSNSKSRVMLKNGQTTLIGGLLRSEQHSQKSAVPLLYKIPVLGYLFQGSRKFNEDKQLLIFITPSII